MDETRQLLVVHLSDIHFGGKHRFMPQKTAGGDTPDEAAYPTLLEKLVEDLTGEDPGCPVLFALTGDMAETGAYDEFAKAHRFVRGIAEATIFERARGLDSIFVVPGNHDVKFDSADVGERWQQWTDFYNGLYGTTVDRADPGAFAGVHDRIDDLGAVIVTLNSTIYVEKDKADEGRGRIDMAQLERLEEELEGIDPERLRSGIGIALIHHHPVLIPGLVEAGRGYDAVHNSSHLLAILRRFGFHAVLHGHKHNPHVFSEDAYSAYIKGDQRPLLVAAGGSAGSTGLPTTPRCGNCYNQLVVKWHPAARQSRIRVTTRGLRIANEDGSERLPGRWQWHTLREDDRQSLGGQRAPEPRKREFRDFEATQDQAAEERRVEEYARLRGYMPVVEVMPSLEPGQAYEARLWLVRHRRPGIAAIAPDVRRVTWSAGAYFPVVTVESDEDPNLCTRLHYWGPMLVQAQMEFEDGECVDAYVYARLPGDHATA
jgi:3',5'-cyclic AMP phosphodiesterase CpdA